jgi:hypothetical protein
MDISTAYVEIVFLLRQEPDDSGSYRPIKGVGIGALWIHSAHVF